MPFALYSFSSYGLLHQLLISFSNFLAFVLSRLLLLHRYCQHRLQNSILLNLLLSRFQLINKLNQCILESMMIVTHLKDKVTWWQRMKDELYCHENEVFQNLDHSTNRVTFRSNPMSLDLLKTFRLVRVEISLNTLYHSLTEYPFIQTYEVLSDL